MSISSQNVRIRRQIGYCAALLLGIVAIAKLPPLLQVVGGVAVLVGSVGLLSEGVAFLRNIQATRRAEEDERQRQEKKQARREREQDAKARRDLKRQMQFQAETRRRDAEERAQEERKRQLDAEAHIRHERERNMQFEAERLFDLEPSAFVEAVCTAFAGANETLEKGERDGEFMYRRPDGTREALFILNETRPATVADVEALEAFRRESNAAYAALISRSGFEAEAVRAASAFPLVLTDPYLIARRIYQETGQP